MRNAADRVKLRIIEPKNSPGEVMKTKIIVSAGIALLGLMSSVQAQDKETLYVKSLAATCANCHGTNGKAVEGSSVVLGFAAETR